MSLELELIARHASILRISIASTDRGAQISNIEEKLLKTITWSTLVTWNLAALT